MPYIVIVIIIDHKSSLIVLCINLMRINVHNAMRFTGEGQPRTTPARQELRLGLWSSRQAETKRRFIINLVETSNVYDRLSNVVSHLFRYQVVLAARTATQARM